MEYLEGETLANRIAARGGVAVADALTIAIQIASALDKAHRAGIVHRDLKPGNIMLTKSGAARPGSPQAKLLDFGLAKTGASITAAAGLSMLPTMPPNLTAQGTILGTFQYMAPEQLEGQDADARSDIFAFGAVVYEMLTGKKAFEGKSQASLIHAIIGIDPPPITARQPLAPHALDRIVRKCLAKDRDARWQSANDLHDALKWIDEAQSPVTPLAVAETRPRPSLLPWAIATLGLLIGAAGWFVGLRHPAEELPVLRLDVTTPPSSDPVSFALSPSGRLLVFVTTADDGASKLWLRPLDQTTAQPLAGTEGAVGPFWAPDSRAVAFFSNGKLKRLDLAAGAPQVLADAPSAFMGGAWSRDGVIVFAPNTTGGLQRVAATGGITTVATRPATNQFSHRLPSFLPDGRHFLFYVGLSQPDVQGVYLGSLDAPDVRRIIAADSAAAYAPPGYLLMVRQGVLMATPFDAGSGGLRGEPVPIAQRVGWALNARGAFSVSTTGILAHRMSGMGRRQLVWFDRRGTEVGTFGEPDEYVVASPDLSSNGQRVAVARVVQGQADIWLIDGARGVRSRFTFDGGNLPVWAPDGSRIAFQATRDGMRSLFEKLSNGARDEQRLFASSSPKIPADYSPDGRTLLYVDRDAATGSDLWALPLNGAQKPFAVVHTRFEEDEGQFSPDGHWLAYRSNESGQSEIYVQRFPGPGAKQLVSSGGGSQPRWRRDGRELFYVAADLRLMAMTIRAAADEQPLDVSTPVPLFPTRLAGTDQPRPQYAVARDGQRFLMNVVADEATTAPITIVQNWSAALKK